MITNETSLQLSKIAALIASQTQPDVNVEECKYQTEGMAFDELGAEEAAVINAFFLETPDLSKLLFDFSEPPFEADWWG